MNRRQVLLGASASATAVAFAGFAPGAGAQGGSASFAPFTQGVRGSYILNGAVALRGTIPVVAGREGPAPTPAPTPTPTPTPRPGLVPTPPSPHLSGPASFVPAPAVQPRMSIVPVQRGSGRTVRSLD
jgi:hypothetical protein